MGHAIPAGAQQLQLLPAARNNFPITLRQ